MRDCFSVAESIIEIARQDLESKLKRNIRRLVLPLVKARLRCERIGEGFQWGFPIRLGRASSVGRYCYIGAGFEAIGSVIVGDLVLISTECKIVGTDHRADMVGMPTRLAFAEKRLTTYIEADVWIGKRVLIKEGVRIGTGAVIGAGSFVNKDVAPYTVVAGVPARKIRDRFSDIEYLKRHHSQVFGSAASIEDY